MYQFSKLDNGLRLATYSMPHMKSVSVGFWIGVGGRHEAEAVSGISHFIEHLLFKGTPTRSPHQISQEIEGVGGYINAYTSEEHTCYYTRATAKHLPVLIDVLSDMFLHSTFPEEEVDKERQVIKEELAMYQDQPSHYVQDLLNETIWPRHPLGRNLVGDLRSLDHISRKELIRFKNRNYNAKTTVIAAAGNIDHNEFVRLLRPRLTSLRTGAEKSYKRAPAIRKRGQPYTTFKKRDCEQANLTLGYRSGSRHDSERYALRVLNTILGENMSSRLFQRIREDRGLAYSVYSSTNFYQDAGFLSISLGLDERRIDETLRLINLELQDLKFATVSKEELSRAKDYLVGQLEISMEGTENQMNWLGEGILFFDKPPSPKKAIQAVKNTTADDIRSLAKTIFHPSRAAAALIANAGSQKRLEKALSDLS